MNSIMKALAFCGWYISTETEVSRIIDIGLSLRKGHTKKVDMLMKNYYVSELDQLL